MKLLLYLLTCLPLCGQVVGNAVLGNCTLGVAAGGAAPSFVLQENFETATTGYEVSWDEYNNPLDPVNASPPSPLAGNQSLKMSPGSDIRKTGMTAMPEVWIYFLWSFTANINSSYNSPLDVRDGSSYLAYFSKTDTEFRLKLTLGATAASTPASGVVGTTYQIWMHYKNNGGTDSAADLEFQTVGTPRSGSGNNFISTTDAASKTDATVLRFQGAGLNETNILDTIRVSTTGYYVP